MPVVNVPISTPTVPATTPVIANNTQPKCDKKSDYDNFMAQMEIILGQIDIEDWFADRITADVKELNKYAPDALKSSLEHVSAVTALYDSELDQANKLCVSTIRSQLETISSVKTLRQVIADVPISAVKDPNAACKLLQNATESCSNGRAIVITCAEQLRRTVLPDHEQVVSSVEGVIAVIKKKGPTGYTPEQIDVANKELLALETKIRTTIHADEQLVQSAGEDFRRCIYRHALRIDLQLARIVGSLDIVSAGYTKSN